jgi:hypothetical protein
MDFQLVTTYKPKGDQRSPTTKAPNGATQRLLSTPSPIASHRNPLKTLLNDPLPSLPIISGFESILIP